MATLLLISALLSTALSQVVPTAGSDTFPSCAVSCPALQAAQGACVPPAVAASDQATYTSCFCQNAGVQAFKNSMYGVCDTVCTAPADLTELQKWYLGTCDSPSQQTTTTTTGKTPDKTDAADAAATTTDGPVKSHTEDGGASQGWFSTHWRWVVMIIVVAVGFTAFACLLLYLKKRHQRKHTAQYDAAHLTAAAAMSSSRIRVDRLSSATPSGRPTPSPRPGGVLVSQALRDEEWGSPQARAHTRGWDFVDAGPPGGMRDGPSPGPSARLAKARR